ncbi:hypothetical protein ACJIZ3_015947 [Penstemon smallii]|uniref:Transcription factor CBF/NF-Y/archaeal histone domain-containing protein n=1 Tax=Penstemon smallii TaxID=265156 RepID=A0ABD3RPR7_9LAMI
MDIHIDEQDKLLPIANVGRIMKHILPHNAKISKEAKVTIQECASEFISFVTSEASDKCHKENRKTVNGDDICWALTSLGFDNYSEAMVRHLHRFREFESSRQRANHEINNIVGVHNNNNKATSTTHEEKHEEEGITNIFEFQIIQRNKGSMNST